MIKTGRQAIATEANGTPIVCSKNIGTLSEILKG
jgi:hypothetical protein